MENATKATLTNVAGQAIHALNNTASQFVTHSTIAEAADYRGSCLWVHPRNYVWIKEGITIIE